ncbi:MAG: N-6 DNA methylase [Candidatus Helarchaeota archaeon]
MDPGKDDTVLDPACGTAGFLISAYKHILEKHQENPLTPDQKQRLTENFVGYDISPDMVRLSRVNMYLHQFPNPTIHEYDTLTTEDRWDDTFDVILANPPFMTPKGGIRPHKRFAVRANRSEVLFVDYIAEHLNVGGRAGVIVPEGIIFQSSKAYKALRKMLVEEGYLYAVVSLPAGIFQPYSGVKTSVLLMDKDLARQADSILFVKVAADGYDLGAQRNEIKENDLPDALEVVKTFQANPQKEPDNSEIAMVVEKTSLGEDGDYNLSAERYRQNVLISNNWPMASLGDISLIISGQSPEGKYYNETGNGSPFYQGKTNFSKKYIGSSNKWTTQDTKIAYKNDILMSVRAPVGPVNLANERICIGRGLAAIRPDKEKANFLYIFYQLRYLEDSIKGNSGSTFASINRKGIQNIAIPLPPLEVQQAIVDEIEGYQKVIDGARQVVENYKPIIHIDPDWPLVKLGDICENLDSKRKPVRKSERAHGPYPYYGASGIVDHVDSYIFDGDFLLISEDGANLRARVTPIAFSISGKAWVNNHAHVLKFNNIIEQEFIKNIINNMDISVYVTGSAQPKLNQTNLNKIVIPLPDTETQKGIIKNINQDSELIDKNVTIIERFEVKIADCIKRVWDQE